MTIYVYAYDVYGARTYFTVSKIPKVVQQDRRALELYLTGLARKKLGVSLANVRLGDYSDEKFDQGHLPHYIYKKGHWRSYTTND
jgi:predicted transcriptional regulator with HTH domain